MKWDRTAGQELAATDVTAGQEMEAEQTRNRNAFYHFRSDVHDGVKDGQLYREETRNGLQVDGSYSYSDGFVRRVVQYRADENGYRVLK